RPVKRARWHQEHAALDYGAPCLQFMEFHKHDKFAGSNMQNESEDCLFLNVFTPFDPEEESKLHPIIVWIHGGSFLAGSGDTGIDMEVITKHFTSNGVALITVNYRLGLLGFLNYKNNEHVEGNFGIWDLVMALEWIQTNVKQLNGDPSKVTIMGESAGAAAVSVLAVSPRTKEMFYSMKLTLYRLWDPEEESKLHPIIVWIHGGSFLAGSGDIGIDMEVITKQFTSNSVALITVNCRLGLLGFSNYKNNENVEGNFGIWDLVMALEWIQTNVKQLNGDPSKVTIMEESAGAAAVSVLAVSPEQKIALNYQTYKIIVHQCINLLHRAIMLSGSSSAGWAIHRFGQPAWSVNNIAAYIGCEKELDKQTIEPLLKLSTISKECNMQEEIPECLTVS
uniref:Carboxylesterase type B domain-containing protein n=1 Tax=Wuchereria bancrofti TaxID=6293 RepID=A0AAF5Q569_WUCBA